MLFLCVVAILVYAVLTVGLGGWARRQLLRADAERPSSAPARLVASGMLKEAGMPKIQVTEGWFKEWSTYDDGIGKVILAPEIFDQRTPEACAVAAMQASRAVVARESPGAWRRRRVAIRWSSALPGLALFLSIFFMLLKRIHPAGALILFAVACVVSLVMYFMTLRIDMRAAMIAKKTLRGQGVLVSDADMTRATKLLDAAPLMDLRGPLASMKWILWHMAPFARRS